MSVWTLWTWVSIVVLIVGSVIVFVWFVFDLLRIRDDILAEERADAADRDR